MTPGDRGERVGDRVGVVRVRGVAGDVDDEAVGVGLDHVERGQDALAVLTAATRPLVAPEEEGASTRTVIE